VLEGGVSSLDKFCYCKGLGDVDRVGVDEGKYRCVTNKYSYHFPDMYPFGLSKSRNFSSLINLQHGGKSASGQNPHVISPHDNPEELTASPEIKPISQGCGWWSAKGLKPLIT
jgi:hypothetical protein